MMTGIYCYKDKKTGKIVYVGKDSHIGINKRHKDHIKLGNYNQQQINKVLQNNLGRYEYHVLKTGEFNDNLLNVLEIIYIKRYGTYNNRKGCGESYGFNFTIGGDGATGYKHLDETKQKMREINTCKYARITNFGKNSSGKKMYVIYRDTKQIKTSINRSKLVNWFTKEYPNEMLKLIV